jgi:hypothetical protein
LKFRTQNQIYQGQALQGEPEEEEVEGGVEGDGVGAAKEDGAFFIDENLRRAKRNAFMRLIQNVSRELKYNICCLFFRPVTTQQAHNVETTLNLGSDVDSMYIQRSIQHSVPAGQIHIDFPMVYDLI